MKLNRENISLAANVAQAFAAILTVLGVVYAAEQVRVARDSEAATLGLQFDDRLRAAGPAGIISTIENGSGDPVLKIHGGEATQGELQQLLADYDTLNYLHRDNLLDDSTVKDLFCHDLEAVHANREVMNYLSAGRAHPGYEHIDDGFDALATKCADWDAQPA